MSQIYLCTVCGEPVVDAPQEHWTSTRVVPAGWRHLDNSALCPGGAPTLVNEPDPADPDATALTTLLGQAFDPAGPYTPARVATAIFAVSLITCWLRAATGPANAYRLLADPADLGRLLRRVFHTSRAHLHILVNLAHHLQELDRADPHVAWAARAGNHLAAAAALAASATAQTGQGWQAVHAGSRSQPDGYGCGCPPRCAACAMPVGAGHDLGCPWRRGSVAHESPTIPPQPQVTAAHIHQPGCRHVTRRPGGLFEQISADGQVRCLMCGRLNTYEGAAVPSFGGTTEHHHRCTACGQTWIWCDMSAII